MTRGKNTTEYWNNKHIQEYDIYEPYDFKQLENSPTSYHKVASNIIIKNETAIKNKSMLEIGCAGGYFSSYMSKKLPHKWKINGWDFSEAGIMAARGRNRYVQNLDFDVVDILETPVDNDYGIICAFETIEHIAEGENYKLLDNWLKHSEYLLLSTVTTKDDCHGEHISHYDFGSFESMGYIVRWKAKLAKIDMSATGDYGDYFYFIVLLRGKLS